jgi:hypothetical protein
MSGVARAEGRLAFSSAPYGERLFRVKYQIAAMAITTSKTTHHQLPNPVRPAGAVVACANAGARRARVISGVSTERCIWVSVSVDS